MQKRGENVTKETEQLLKLIRENPDLPVIPMVNEEVVADDSYSWWRGEWRKSEVTDFYEGREYIHFRSDDEEDVMTDMVGCNYSETKDGRDVYDLEDAEWDEIYNSLPWKKAIVVYIGV